MIDIIDVNDNAPVFIPVQDFFGKSLKNKIKYMIVIKVCNIVFLVCGNVKSPSVTNVPHLNVFYYYYFQFIT